MSPDQTLLLFDGVDKDDVDAARWVCARCGMTQSGDARFCPFDGEPLLAHSPERGVPELTGRVLDGRYRILGVVGSGTMGTVYRAEHVTLGRQLAVKVLRPELAREPLLAEQFLLEARVAASIDHPAVVAITDFGQLPSGEPYFVMELLEGVQLSRLVRQKGPLTLPAAVSVLHSVADALRAAHALGHLHRNLRIHNVLVGRMGRGLWTKVLDFGLARVAGRSSLTRASGLYGDPRYLSPEEIGGAAGDALSDVYGFGLLAFEVTTGRAAFEGDSFAQVAARQLGERPPRLSVASGDAQFEVLDTLVERCLAKSPAERPASMAEVASELWALQQSFSVPPAMVARESTLPPLPVARGASLVLWAATFLAVGAALGGGLWWWQRAKVGGAGEASPSEPSSGELTSASQGSAPQSSAGGPVASGALTPSSAPASVASASHPVSAAATSTDSSPNRTQGSAGGVGVRTAPKTPAVHGPRGGGEIVDPWAQ